MPVLKNNFYLFLYFTIVVIIGNYSFFYYDYHMDDAWVIGANYLHSSIFTSEGLSSALEKILNDYHEHFNIHERFIGITPIIRLLEVLISSDVKLHLILNLLFHIINSYFVFIILTKYFKSDNYTAFILSTLFALALNINTGTYALSLWIGSSFVNLFTLLILLFFQIQKINKDNKLAYILYAIYFVLGIGDYSMAVVIPPVSLLIYSVTKDLRLTFKYFIILIIPIIINLIIRSFAPPSSYVGTQPNFDIEHITNNIVTIVKILIGGDITYQYIFVGLVLLILIIGIYKNKFNLVNLLIALCFMFGYITLYAISSRTSFENPYFLYIPYIGLIFLLGLIFNYLNFKKIYLSIIIVFIGFIQYKESIDYRTFRENTSAAISELREEFRKIEKLTKSENKQMVILLYDKFPDEKYTAMGYFDNTINTWRNRNNNSSYHIATDYIKTNDTVKFLIGINQYYKGYERYISIDKMLKKEKINEYIILRIQNNNFVQMDTNNFKKKNIVFESKYKPEYYGNGQMYNWTDGNLKISIHSSSDDIGKYANISFNITSLFNDKINIYYDGYSNDSIAVKANTTFNFCKTIKISSLKENIILKSNKVTIPKGDTRYLSFRIDTISHEIINRKEYSLDVNLRNISYKGFYDVEQNYFRWTSPNASLNFNQCLPIKTHFILILNGGFMNETPDIIINSKHKPIKKLIKTKNSIEYIFRDVNEDVKKIEFHVKQYIPNTYDPRRLGFMFYNIMIKYNDEK